MIISVAQTRPVTGDIQRNVVGHQRLIDLAVSNGAELVVFPELSISSYAPTLAKDLATNQDDRRFDIFQTISDTHHISIGIGAPIRNREGIRISLILFQAGKARQVYSKMHLHSSEEPFFVRGPESANMIGDEEKIALAICYELSVPEHAADASKKGAEIYLASVADSVNDIDRVLARLGTIAREYSMTVLMSNCIGSSGGWQWAGRSSVWGNQGELLAQLDDAKEGIIVFDTETQDVAQSTIETNCD